MLYRNENTEKTNVYIWMGSSLRPTTKSWFKKQFVIWKKTVMMEKNSASLKWLETALFAVFTTISLVV